MINSSVSLYLFLSQQEKNSSEENRLKSKKSIYKITFHYLLVYLNRDLEFFHSESGVVLNKKAKINQSLKAFDL